MQNVAAIQYMQEWQVSWSANITCKEVHEGMLMLRPLQEVGKNLVVGSFPQKRTAGELSAPRGCFEV